MSGLGFLSPWMLLAFPLMGALLALAYRKHGRGQRVIVGTLMLLQRLAEKSQARQKFSPPLRFFFELALLLLLAAGAARLYSAGSVKRVAILVDNSLSMSAKNSTGASRLEQLKSEAKVALDALTGSNVFTLFATTPELSELLSGERSVSAVASALDQIPFAFGTDRLDAVLPRLISGGQFDEIHLFSDRKVEAISTASSLVVHTILDSNANGSSGADNLAISGVSLSSEREVVVSVQSFSHKTMTVDIKLDVAGQIEGLSGFSNLQETKVDVVGLGSADVKFKLRDVNATGFRAALQAAGDTLEGDNFAFFTPNQTGQGVVIVSEGGGTFGLERLKKAGVRGIKLSDYNSQTEPAAGLLIFYRCYPGRLPLANSFFILPPPGSGFAEKVQDGKRIEVTTWETLHPIVRYLNLPVLSLSSAVQLNPPIWGQSLISSTAGSLAFAGERDGFRYFAVGFEILPFEGRRAPITGILTLNAIGWLSGAGLSSGAGAPGTVVNLKEGTVSARYVDGEELPILDGTPQSISPKHPGIVLLQSASGEKESASINYYDPEESALSTAVSLAVPASGATGSQLDRDRPELLSKVAWVVLLLLFGDMLLMALRSRRAAA